MFEKLRIYRPDLTETLRLSVPIVIAQLGVVLMGVTDNLFVGQLLGPVPLGAAGLAVSLSFLVSCIGVGALAVVATLISQAQATNDVAGVNRLFRAGVRVAILLSLLLGGVSVLVAYSFDLFGQTPQVTAMARQFMIILSVSIVPLFLFMAARQLCDGLAFPRVAMYITLSALVVNALFNYLLIKGVGPFPQMGLNGSAMATLISRLYMAAAILFYLLRSSKFRPYLGAHFRQFSIRAEVTKIIKLGLPGGLTFFFEVAAFSCAVVVVGWLGEDRLAAHQIALNLASTTYMMASGISAAGAIRVGSAVGSGSRERVFRAGVAAFALSATFMALCAILFLSANEWLVSWYIDIDRNQSVATIAASLVIMAGLFQLSDGIQVVAVGTLRGLSDVNVPTLMTLFAYWIVGLPLGYALAFWANFDAAGIWVGLLVGLTVAAILLTTRFFRLIWRANLAAVAKQSATVGSH